MPSPWCFEAEQTPPVMELLGRAQSNGAVAPQLWPIEAANALLMAERRGRINATKRLQLSDVLAELPIRLDDETSTRAWHVTSGLAELHGLSAYDATYLDLAIRLTLPLATADRRLAATAMRAGTPLLPAP